jgi:hypothetical protein
MKTITIPMKINSEKKHSVRYDAVDKNAAVQSIYVANLPSPPPQTINVKVEYDH